MANGERTKKIKRWFCQPAEAHETLCTADIAIEPHFSLNWTHAQNGLEYREYKCDSNDTSGTCIAFLIAKVFGKIQALCSVQRELSSIRPSGFAQWGNNFHAKLVCRGCVSIVPAKPYVEFQWMFKDTPKREVVQSHFYINVVSCQRNQRKCENQEKDLNHKVSSQLKSGFTLTEHL